MFRLATITPSVIAHFTISSTTTGRLVAAIALSVATVTATLIQPATVASATTLPTGIQGQPLATGGGAQATPPADLVVLFQKVEPIFGGYQWTYTVANAMPNPAKNVIVTKGVKVLHTGQPNTLAAPPQTQNLNTLAPYEVRVITMSCGNSTPQAQCVGTSLSAKTSTPEVITTNNSASHSFK